jgi:hypothetical protein
MPAAGADLFAGYSGLRAEGDLAHGGALAVATARRGATLRLGLEVSAHFDTAGEGLGDYAALATLAVAPWPRGRISPFLSVGGGLAGVREQVTLFGVAIGPEGVCDGGCPYSLGPAAEAGGGLDVRVGGRWALRLGATYRVHWTSGASEGALRVLGGIARR